MWKPSFMLLILGVANLGFSEEKQSQPVTYALPHTEAYYRPLDDQTKPAFDNNDERVKHLLQAAEHLEAAGFQRGAEGIRRIAKGGKESINAWIALSERDLQPAFRPQPIVQPPYGIPALPPQPYPGAEPPNAMLDQPNSYHVPTTIPPPQQNTPEASQAQNKSVDQKPIVLLHISVIEVPHSKLKKLGFDSASFLPNGSPDSAAKAQKQTGVGGDPFGGFGKFQDGVNGMLKEDDPYFLALQAMIKDKIANVIAEPKLMTRSGCAASVHVGGEIPMPAAPGNVNQTVEYKEFGNRFDCLPNVLDKDRIQLELRGRISNPDYKHCVKINGTDVPGIRSTNFATDLTIKTGHVVVLGGLVERRLVANTDTKDSEMEKSEEFTTVWIIKPEIVEPMQTAKKPDSGSPIQ